MRSSIAVDKTSLERMHETLAYAHRQHHYIVSAIERGEGSRVEALMREHTNPVKESHFQIDVRPGDSRLARLARRIRGEDEAPGSGAGSIDPFLPDRRR